MNDYKYIESSAFNTFKDAQMEQKKSKQFKYFDDVYQS